MKSEIVPGGPQNGPQGIALSGGPGNPKFQWVSGWVLLSVLAIPFAGLLMAPISTFLLAVVNAFSAFGWFTIGSGEITQAIGTLFGLAITTSVTQWWLLRPFLPSAQRWIPVTMAGWLVGGLVIAAEVTISN
ncbi:MAG: hypothetical protein IMF03_06895, partial [Proteobacteria bacterium]|nr:hypothetical protein [Pseudomonadota bacterium]